MVYYYIRVKEREEIKMQEFINAFNSEETTAKELMEIIEKVLDKWSKVMYNKLIKWKRGNKNEVRAYQCN